MRKITNILMSAYIFIIFARKNTKAEANKCQVEVNATIVVLNCSRKNLTSIPTTPKTTVLDLTDSVVDVLDETSFKNYSTLVSLIMRRTKVDRQQSTTIFEPLENLYSMIMDEVEMDFDKFVNYKWPKNVEEFTLSNTNITDNQLSLENQFPKLKRISLKGNKFSIFPKFNRFSPLEEIDVDSMNIGMVAEDIVPYCRLKIFRADLAFSKIADAGDYCFCLNVEEWLNKQRIRTNMVKCNASASLIKASKCSYNIGQVALSTYESCLKTMPPTVVPIHPVTSVHPIQPFSNKTTNFIAWSIFFLILIMLIIAACIVYIKKTRPQMEKENDMLERETRASQE